jgi:hypothetical protein
MSTALAAAYVLIVTVVTPDQIAEMPWPPDHGGYVMLAHCLDDLKFYKERWPETPDTAVYFRCDEAQGTE